MKYVNCASAGVVCDEAKRTCACEVRALGVFTGCGCDAIVPSFSEKKSKIVFSYQKNKSQVSLKKKSKEGEKEENCSFLHFVTVN